MKSRVIGAFVLSGTGKSSQQIPAFGSGRVCEAPRCTTVLSTYNPSSYCSLHEAGGMPRRARSR